MKARFGASILQSAALPADGLARLVLYHFPEVGQLELEGSTKGTNVA
jgi:hypothetical protein